VAFVYDVLDTEGKPLPEDVASFFAYGSIDEKRLASFIPLTDISPLWKSPGLSSINISI